MDRKLKIALRRGSSEQGFAMPIAVGIGLIMLLVGVTMIIRAQGDQVTASAQKATARGLNTAEAGITRVQSLLNKHRIFANITLTNVDSISSWRRVYDASPDSECSPDIDEISKYRINEWITLDSGGQFRIKEYTYIPISGSAQVGLVVIFGNTNPNALVISPDTYLARGGSVEGRIQNTSDPAQFILGTLSRDTTTGTYTFQRSVFDTKSTTYTASTFVPSPSNSAEVTGGVTIPASGFVTLTIPPNVDGTPYLVNGGSAEGQIEGIQGTLFRSVSGYTFERLIPGTETNTTGKFFPTRTSGTSTLTVEGRVNQAGTDNTATQTLGTANSQLVVNIPVNASSKNIIVPGLWVKTNKITDIGNDKVNGTILINSCPPASSTDEALLKQVGANSTNVYEPSTQKVVPHRVTFPEAPVLPLKTDGTPYYYPIIGSPFDKTFPRIEDVPAKDGYYHYLLDNLEDKGSGTITITPGKKVFFYVKGNINLSGSPNINPTLNNTAAQLQIYGNTYTNLSKTETKYGCATGTTIKVDCPTLTAHFNGSGTMKAFVYAPDATGSVSGGGDEHGNFIGAVLLNDWVASSKNTKVKIDASGNYNDYLITKKIIIPPLISPVTSWLRQETSP